MFKPRTHIKHEPTTDRKRTEQHTEHAPRTNRKQTGNAPGTHRTHTERKPKTTSRERFEIGTKRNGTQRSGQPPRNGFARARFGQWPGVVVWFFELFFELASV